MEEILEYATNFTIHFLILVILKTLHLLNHSLLVQAIHKVVMVVYFSLLLLEFLPYTQDVEQGLESALKEGLICFFSDNISIVFYNVYGFVEEVN